MSELQVIEVRGAAEHNLKAVDLDIPKRQLVVFTGPSGSGKSSLAFDTVYAEGQRRYVESLSAYARQFLGQLDKPKYESMRGLSPTIAIEQKAAARNPRSTVGTITEIHDYLRVLWARTGIQHCPGCGEVVGKRSADEMVDAVMKLGDGTRILLLAPKIADRKGEHGSVLEIAKRSGFTRVRVDGVEHPLDQPVPLNKKVKHRIDIVVDRLVVRADIRPRLADSIETCLREGDGRMWVALVPHATSASTSTSTSTSQELFFSERAWCPRCDRSFTDLEPNSFSFNAPMGACPGCNGLGQVTKVDEALLIDQDLSIDDGAIRPWGALGDEERTAWHVEYRREILSKLAVPTDKAWKKLTDKQRHLVLHGFDDRIAVNWNTTNGKGTFNTKFDGVVAWLERTMKESDSDWRRDRLGQYFSSHACAACNGGRLKPESAAVRVGGRSITEVCRLTIADAHHFFTTMALEGARAVIATGVLKEVRNRLRFLVDVGLDYLTLDRSGPTLSGGEAQRIRLASQIGSELTGVLYVLDEPSIGLHQRDNDRLIATLRHLRDLGNTVLVVEHDEDTIRAADVVVDFGPGAGIHGGEIIYAGPASGITDCARSITGDFLSGRRSIAVPAQRRPGNGKRVTAYGCRANNLKDIDVSIPLGTFTAITGVSGAGKSSFLNHILYPALGNHFNGSADTVGDHDEIQGLDELDKVIAINQQSIGRTPRSNPATYVKVWDHVRTVFSATREARMAGFGPSRFSFNVKGGRCEACEGDGVKKVEMHFLADVFVPCDVCRGKRFNEATLRVLYRGKNIAEVLAMTVAQAMELFDAHPPVTRILQTLIDVGLDYIALGQSATTLSGGEAQRIKLAKELARRDTGKTLYILDEPSTGLHFEDVRKLLTVLDRLVESGNTVVVIEHNLDLIKVADWIIDLGPEGGAKGGTIIAQGTPEQVAQIAASHTGRYLKRMLPEAIGVSSTRKASGGVSSKTPAKR